jgi:NAD-dependent histone deacetylase SIR2
LRTIGQVAFAEETIGSGTITAKKLCTAFGIAPPAFLEGAPDRAYLPLLLMGMDREYSKRLKLPQYNTLDDAVELLKKSKNIIVLTGAGVCAPHGFVMASADADVERFRRYPRVWESRISAQRTLGCIRNWSTSA